MTQIEPYDPQWLKRVLAPRKPTDFVTTRGESVDAGLTDREIARLRFVGWHRVAKGLSVVTPAAEASFISLAAATTRLSGGRAVASHLTAAKLHGIDVVDGLPGVREGQPSDLHLHIIVSTPNGVRYPAGVKVHRTRLSRNDVTTIDGVAVTSPTRTLADLLLTQPRILAIAAVEQALQMCLVEPGQFKAVTAIMRCRPGARRGHDWLRLVTPGTESPLETLSRLRFTDCGLVPSRIQPVILDRDGRFVARADFEFDEGGRKVLGEADGRTVHDLPSARYEDRAREDALRQLGYEVVRWVWTDVTQNLDELVARIRRWL